MSLWNVQGPLLHFGDHIVPRILTVDYTFKRMHYYNLTNDDKATVQFAKELISSRDYRVINLCKEHLSFLLV